MSEVQVKRGRVNNRTALGWDCGLAGPKSCSKDKRSHLMGWHPGRQARCRDPRPPCLRALRDRRDARGDRYTERMRIAAPRTPCPPFAGRRSCLERMRTPDGRRSVERVERFRGESARERGGAAQVRRRGRGTG